jgi:hypothetical protein
MQATEVFGNASAPPEIVIVTLLRASARCVPQILLLAFCCLALSFCLSLFSFQGTHRAASRRELRINHEELRIFHSQTSRSSFSRSVDR